MDEWNDYIKGLRHVGISLCNTKYLLPWIMEKRTGNINANTANNSILSCFIKLEPHWWYKMWTSKKP